jgi:uncharacterized protein YcbX
LQIGSLKELRRYPVKSMGGELLEEAELTAGGLAGDRAWAVRDEVRGGIRGAKKIPALMGLRARYEEPPAKQGSSPAEILFPDGSNLRTGDPEINDRLSKAVGQAISLWPLLPAEDLDHYRRGAPTHEDLEQELRSIFGRTPDEPLPDLSIFPPALLQYESPPGSYFDAYPLLLLTESSLREMQRRAPESLFDVRRFRPNFLISDTVSSTPFPENEWRGRRLQIGDAIVSVTIECPRCVMVTHGFEDLPEDRELMRALVRESAGHLGVYATTLTPGRIRVGDPIRLLS